MVETHHARMERWYGKMPKWDADLPADLWDAVNAVREQFNDHHGWIATRTAMYCYGALQNDPTDLSENIMPIQELGILAGPEVAGRFAERETVADSPHVLAAFFNLYLDATGEVLIRALENFMKIGLNNRDRLPTAYVRWAAGQARLLIDSGIYQQRFWLHRACDKYVEPFWDDDEGSPWNAPSFLRMAPLGNRPYSKRLAWDRLNAEGTHRLLLAYEDKYRFALEGLVTLRERDLLIWSAQVEVSKADTDLSEGGETRDSEKRVAGASSHSGVSIPVAKRLDKAATKGKKWKDSLRHAKIHRAITLGLGGLAYCKYLDQQGVTPPLEWARDPEWPGTYAAVYGMPVKLSSRWKQKVQNEKNKHNRA